MLFEADYAKNYASILYQCLKGGGGGGGCGKEAIVKGGGGMEAWEMGRGEF